jgi:hypothetical protein
LIFDEAFLASFDRPDGDLPGSAVEIAFELMPFNQMADIPFAAIKQLAGLVEANCRDVTQIVMH